MQQQSNSDSTSHDARKFPLCAPWSGHKGAPFERFFNDMKIALASIELKDAYESYDLQDHVLGLDDGGDNGGPDLAQGAAALKRQKTRQRRSFAILHSYVTDESIKKMLRDEAVNNGRAAWQVLIREGRKPTTELELEDLKMNVRTLTIKGSCGYNDFSLSQFHRALSDENGLIISVADRLYSVGAIFLNRVERLVFGSVCRF